jgi:hypothetical protein
MGWATFLGDVESYKMEKMAKVSPWYYDIFRTLDLQLYIHPRDLKPSKFRNNNSPFDLKLLPLSPIFFAPRGFFIELT